MQNNFLQCQIDTHSRSRCGFSKIVSSKERVKPFLTFKIIITHILPENLIEVPQVVQKI